MKRFTGKKIVWILCCGLLSASMYAQVKISGKVTDNNGDPVPGTNVLIKGTATGTVTDSDGSYTVSAPDAGTVIVFSFMGYESQEMMVGDKTSINITLMEATTEIEEVVVVGFGTQKKVNLIGAVNSVGSEVFENRPIANIGQALQGIVPNLNIGIDNGAPNAVPSFNIRGGTSIAKNANGNWAVTSDAPLILVDGVEMTPTLLNQMNPNDIDNMSVIKDASAAAIYGTKAAFGVILITTKSGKFNQKGKISYSYDISWNTPSALPDIMNAYEIQRFVMQNAEWTLGTVSDLDRRKLEAIEKYMADPTPENRYMMNGNSIVWVGDMNPYKLAVRNWYPMQKHNINFSGGTEKVTYYASLGYQNQSGAYRIGDDEQKRYNALVRFSARITDRFNLDAKVNYNRTDYQGPYVAGYKGNMWSTLKQDADKNINMPVMTGPNDPIPNTYTDNYLAWLSYGARTYTDRWTTVLALSPEFIIVPDMLKVKADLSYTPQGLSAKRRSPGHDYVTFSWNSTVREVAEVADNRARLEKSNTDTYLINTYIDFNRTFFEKHDVSAILGFSQEQVTYSQQVDNLRGLFSPDIMKPDAAEDETLHTISTLAQRRTGRAVFGRINYAFNNRYLFEFNGRYDGSSRFTKDRRFIFCPSFSVGWRISEESFMAGTRSWLNHLKVRFTSGKLLNQPGDYYPYQPVMGSGSANFILVDRVVNTVNPPILVSPTLTFEKVRTDNYGLDIAVLKNRLIFTFEYYQRKTMDILVSGSEAYPTVIGANPPLVNSGILKTQGFDILLEWKDRLHNGLGYNVALSLSDAMTGVKYFPGNPTKIIGQLYDGAKVNEIWGYETGGILQESDMILDKTANRYYFSGPYTASVLYPGDPWVRDLNGDGIINTGSNTVDDPGDRRIIGNSTPRYRYGASLGAAWNGFDLNIFFQGVAQRDLWISSTTYWGGGTNNAGSKWMYERSWKPDRTDAKFPRYRSTAGAPATQTAWMVNGAFLRLKQAVLSYSLPGSLTAKMRISRLRFTLAGYNLLEITKVPSIFDPEQISDAYPQYRSVSIGAQITF
ncbi:MAG: TonB-dependent receptor [Bacteroidales bacterium]|jgi:TonB-linked SusC/RagA family outer membrane protein|nr:TonB-dependent receptor [Bacteroidales bacterium]